MRQKTKQFCNVKLNELIERKWTRFLQCLRFFFLRILSWRLKWQCLNHSHCLDHGITIHLHCLFVLSFIVLHDALKYTLMSSARLLNHFGIKNNFENCVAELRGSSVCSYFAHSYFFFFVSCFIANYCLENNSFLLFDIPSDGISTESWWTPKTQYVTHQLRQNV